MRCDELAWPLCLPYSLLTYIYLVLLNAIATMSGILVWGIYVVIVLACVKLPPHMGDGDRVVSGGEQTFPRSSDWELGIVCWARSYWAPVMGDRHLWRVRGCSFGNYGGVRRAIPVMGADCRSC